MLGLRNKGTVRTTACRTLSLMGNTEAELCALRTVRRFLDVLYSPQAGVQNVVNLVSAHSLVNAPTTLLGINDLVEYAEMHEGACHSCMAINTKHSRSTRRCPDILHVTSTSTEQACFGRRACSANSGPPHHRHPD